MDKRCDKIPDLDYDKFCRVPKSEGTYVFLSCQNNSKGNYLNQLPFAEVSFIEYSFQESNTSNLDDIEEHLTDTDKRASFRQRGLHILHLNINSLLPKIDELRLIALKTNTAVIGLSETNLDKSVLDGEVIIDGYEIKRADRNRHGGGVACYIRKDLVFSPRENLSADVENIFLDVQLPKSRPILLGVFYRTPTASGFLDKQTISKPNDFDNQEVYILGDLHINLNNKN